VSIRLVAINVADTATLTASASQNLLLRSQEFDNATWTGAATHTPNTDVAPDGTTTADTITDSSAVATQGKTQAVTIPNDSADYYLSVYVKIGTAGGLPYLRISLALSGGTAVSASVVVETQTGTVLFLAGTFGFDMSVAGWVRVWLRVFNNTTGNVTATVDINPAWSATGAPTVQAVSQTRSIVVWGAMLRKTADGEDNAAGYVPTTTVAASGGGFAATLPVGNLQLEGRARVARTTDSWGTKYILGDFADANEISAVVLYDHNLSAGCTIRIQLFSGVGQTGSTLYDNAGWTPFITPSWSGFGPGGNAPSARYSALWITPVTGVRSFRLMIYEGITTKPAYTQIKRLLMGSYFEPAANAALGLSLSWNDSSVQRRTQGGSIRTESRSLYRSLVGQLDQLTEAERYKFFDALHSCGTRKEVFVSVFPSLTDLQGRDFSMLGKFTRLPPVNVVQATTYSSGFEIEEV
jgi:hypothetical protein